MKKAGAIIKPIFILRQFFGNANFINRHLEYLETSHLIDNNSKPRKMQQKDRDLEGTCDGASSSKVSDNGLSSLSSLSSNELEHILSYIGPNAGIALSEIGSKPLLQKLNQMRSINLTPPVASEYYWPESVLSHIGDVKDLTISTPEYYEHMPMNHFSSRSLSDKLHRLSLTFRNAALLLKQVPQVKSTFPTLESLKIGGNDGPSIHFTSGTIDSEDGDDEYVYINRASIDGLVTLELPQLDISLSDINELPESLTEISRLMISESGDNGPEVVPKWPSKLIRVDVDAGVLGMAAIRGLSELMSLSDLRFFCTESSTSDLKVTDNDIKQLPQTLTSLEIRVGKTGSGGDANSTKGLSSSLFALLPPSLENLEVWKWPKPLDFTLISKLSNQIKKLRIHEKVDFDSKTFVDVDMSLIPSTVVDLMLPASFEHHKSENFEEILEQLPSSLTRLSWESLFSGQLKKLPKSLTDLELSYLEILDEDGDAEEEEKDDEDDNGDSMDIDLGPYPPLRRFMAGELLEAQEADFDIAKLFPLLETFNFGTQREFSSGSERNVGRFWKHYSDGVYDDEDDWSTFVSRMPNLRSFRVPYDDSIEPYPREAVVDFLDHIPKSVTAISLEGCDSSVTSAELAHLPPHLTYFAIPGIIKIVPEELKKLLPSTLRVLASHDLPLDFLPPYCKFLPLTGGVDDPLLRGEWWRLARDVTVDDDDDN